MITAREGRVAVPPPVDSWNLELELAIAVAS
jgi:hypothetical protein